jgi:hypothetical protein
LLELETTIQNGKIPPNTLPRRFALSILRRMTERAPTWRLLLHLLLSFFLAGCTQMRRAAVDDEKEPQYLEGQKRANRMDWDGAIDSFEHALQANPKNASAHFQLGVLYDTKKNDYSAAIYHYQRHLMLRTNSPMADLVKQNITACTRELAKSVRMAVLTPVDQRDLTRLHDTNVLLQARVQFLESELTRRPQYVTNYITNFVGVPQSDGTGGSRLTRATHSVPPPDKIENPPESPSVTRNEPHAAPKSGSSKPTATNTRHQPSTPDRRQPEPAVAQTGTRSVHTVRPGETLASLASRYGVSLPALKAANPGAAGGVRAGQKIDIPK